MPSGSGIWLFDRGRDHPPLALPPMVLDVERPRPLGGLWIMGL